MVCRSARTDIIFVGRPFYSAMIEQNGGLKSKPVAVKFNLSLLRL
jgi:hypothetical protein